MLSYQGSLWPVHPRPIEGEVLSSWISRIGLRTDLPLHQFMAQQLPGGLGGNRDLDQVEDSRFFDTLTAGTGVARDQILSASYVHDEGRVYSRRKITRLEWIAPCSVDTGRVRKYSLPFCPSCLARDDEPYYRKRWRYAFAPLCPEHGLLTNHCPHCSLPYSYQHGSVLRGVASGTIGVCRHCCEPFRPTSGSIDASLDDALSAQWGLIQGLEEGWIDVKGLGPVHVCMYLRGLHEMFVMALNPRHGPLMVQWYLKESGRNHVPPPLPRTGNVSVEALPADVRAWLLGMGSWFLEEWPHRFISMADVLGSEGAYLSEAARRFPGWMNQPVIQERVSRHASRQSEREAAAASLRKAKKWAFSDQELIAYMNSGVVAAVTPVQNQGEGSPKNRWGPKKPLFLYAYPPFERTKRGPFKAPPRTLYEFVPFTVEDEPSNESDLHDPVAYQRHLNYVVFAGRDGTEDDDP